MPGLSRRSASPDFKPLLAGCGQRKPGLRPKYTREGVRQYNRSEPASAFLPVPPSRASTPDMPEQLRIRRRAMSETITRRDTLRGGFAAISALALVPEWIFPALADDEIDVPFTDIPKTFNPGNPNS